MRKNKIQILLIIFMMVFTTGLIQPSLSEAADYDYGEVEIGSTKTTPVRIKNIAPGSVTITLEFDNTACTDFSVVSAPTLVIPALGEIEIEVGFTPLKIGSCSNTLTVAGNSTDPALVTLTGTGIEAISDQTEPFNISRPHLNQNGEKFIVICHKPPGSDKAKTLIVGADSLDAHLDHGDTPGSCGK